MKHPIIFLLLLTLIYSCTNHKEEKQTNQQKRDTVAKTDVVKDNGITQQDSIKATGRAVLALLKSGRYKDLTPYFSTKGVRFSPYGFIDTATHKKLSPTDFLESIDKNWILTWGNADGTGDPIKLTVKAYLKKFVTDADYQNAEAISFDKIMKQGNSKVNLAEIYPNHHFMDYHFSGFAQEHEGMDWKSLKLVFEKEDGQYFLVAIIHDQWTI